MNETGLDYSAFLMELPEPVIAIDHHGTIVGCNRAASIKFDYSREELRGRNIRTLIPEPDRSHHDEYISRYLETGQKKIIDVGRRVHAQAKSGKLIPVFLTVCEQKTASGSIFIGLLRDLSELDLTNTRLSAILQSTPSDILYMDMQLNVRYLNHGFQDFIGREFLNTSILEVLDETNASNLKSFFEDCIRDQATIPFTLRMAGGKEMRIFSSSITPIIEGGAPTGAVLVMTDITEKMELEKSQKRLLVQKELLLKEVYHRVKNNFQVIQSLLAINEMEEVNENAREVLRDTRNRIFAMASIHDFILERHDDDQIDLSHYLSMIDAKFRMANQSGGHGLAYPSLEIAVVPAAAQVLVDADQATACGVILTELLTNSVKYARDQTNEVRVLYGIDLGGDSITLRYSDSGPLYSSRSDARETWMDTHTPPVSTGMGRRIINSFAESLNGTIRLDAFSDWMDWHYFADLMPDCDPPLNCFTFTFRSGHD